MSSAARTELQPIGQPPTNHKKDRRWLYLALTIYAILVVRIVATRQYWPSADSSLYISAAIAFYQGLGFVDITAPVSKPEQNWMSIPPWIKNNPAAYQKPYWPFFRRYPPIIPLMLVPLLWLGNGSFLVMQLLTISCGVLTLLAMYRWRYLLFAESWQIVLLWTTASQATLYATRILVDAVMIPLVIITIVLLLHTYARQERLLRNGIFITLILMASAFTHQKIIFVTLGTMVAILAFRKARLSTRLIVFAMVLNLVMIPIFWWTRHVTLPTFSITPVSSYFFQYSTSSSATDNSLLSIAWCQILLGGWYCIDSVGLLLLRAQVDTNIFAVLAFYLCLLVGMVQAIKNGRFVVVVCLACHLLGANSVHWASPRHLVMVTPFIIYVLVLGLRSILKTLCLPVKRVHAPVSAALIVVLSGILLHNWARLQPWRDYWCSEGCKRLTVYSQLTRQLPEDRVILLSCDDPSSIAVTSGRTTIALHDWDYFSTHAPNYFNNGGVATAIFKIPEEASKDFRVYMLSNLVQPADTKSFTEDMAYEMMTSKPELAWLKNIKTNIISAYGYNFTMAYIGEDNTDHTIEFLQDDNIIIPTKVHPRWFRLKSGDAETLYRKAFPK